MLRPQDVMVLGWLALQGDGSWRYADLAHELGLSASESHAAVGRVDHVVARVRALRLAVEGHAHQVRAQRFTDQAGRRQAVRPSRPAQDPAGREEGDPGQEGAQIAVAVAARAADPTFEPTRPVLQAAVRPPENGASP